MSRLTRYFLIGVLAGWWAVPVLAAEKCTTPFLFDPKPTFGLHDLSRLAVENKPIYDDEFVFWVDEFDDEDQPQKDGRLAVGVVFAGRPGIAEPVVGGVLWSRRFAKWNETRSGQMTKETKDGQFAVFTLDDPTAACPNRNFVVHFDKHGALWADGKKVAQLPPE
jgi:hypothetical protein